MKVDSPYDFSVITVCYNSVDTIARCVESVLGQKSVSIQYIVIDGASTDGTKEYLSSKRGELDQFISEPDKGIYDAMNKGLGLVQGKWVAIINSDDALLPHALLEVKNAFESSGAQIIHGNLLKERYIAGKSYQQIQKPSFSDMRKSMGVNHPATFVSQEVYSTIGHFDTRYALSADYDFILKAYESGVSFSYLDKELTLFSLNGRSSVQCKSYYETFLVHQRHRTGHTIHRFTLIFTCILKKLSKSTIRTLAQMVGMNSYLNQRLINKWSNSVSQEK